MRTITSEIFKQQFGLEPVLVVAIKLTDWFYYGDREHERFQGRITDVQNLDNVINITQNATTASVTIQFIDVDGELKRLYDANDLHMLPLKIYQYFIGSDFDTDKILLFEGYIASPVVYNEAQMSLTVTGLSRIKNIEVGFSVDNALWTDIIPNELEPRAWPMPFGTPINYPIVSITDEPIGKLLTSFGIEDFTLGALSRASAQQRQELNSYTTLINRGVDVSWVKFATLKKAIETAQDEMMNMRDHFTSVMHKLSTDNQLANEQHLIDSYSLNPYAENYSADIKRFTEDATHASLQRIEAATISLDGKLAHYTHPATDMQRAQVALSDAQGAYQKRIEVISKEIARLRTIFQNLEARKQFFEQEHQRITQQQQQATAVRSRQWQEPLLILAQQKKYSPVGKEIIIFNGKRFPPNKSLWLNIGGALLRGKFTHTEQAYDGLSYFKVAETVHPLRCQFSNQHCTELEAQKLQELFFGSGTTIFDELGKYSWQRSMPKLSYTKFQSYLEQLNELLWDFEDDPLDGERESHPLISTRQHLADKASLGVLEGETAGFAWINAGSHVRIAYEFTTEYVVSIVPCEVLRLAAYRSSGGERHLQTIPSSWYELITRDYGGGLVATVAIFKRPIDSMANLSFEPQIFATVKSSIGPNVVDVIRYLVEKYLPDTICDEASFAQAAIDTAPWPVNFALLDKRILHELLVSICRQACLALWQYDGRMYLRYLPNIPKNAIEISEDNIDAESLELIYTQTEDVVTKFIAVYRTEYTQEEPYRLAARYNISKYDVNTEVIDYFIYNDREAVVQSVTFKLIRQANTWKHLVFSTALDTMVLDTLDAVKIDLHSQFAAYEAVVGIVEEAQYDSSTFTIKYQVWLPVRAGEMHQYKFAYLDVGDIDDEFPEPRDWVTGNGLGAPIIRTLNIGIQGKNAIISPSESWSNRITLDPPRAPINLTPRRPRIIDPLNWEPTTAIAPREPDIDPGYGPESPPLVDFSFVSGPLPEDLGEILPDPHGLDVLAPESLNIISLQRTVIIDDISKQIAPLGTFFVVGNAGNLAMRSKIQVVASAEDQGTFEFMFDPSRKEFGAKIAFLADEPEPEPEPEPEAG